MSISRTTLSHIAALACAIPGITVRFETDSGQSIVVSDEPGASICTCSFRKYVSAWPGDSAHDPCISQVEYEGVTVCGGVLADARSRWFVSELSTRETSRCIRESGLPVLTRIWEDPDLDVCVVQVQAQASVQDTLDLTDATLSLYSAVMVAELSASLNC